eukprot:Hpha_TRINITY_DN14219_c0_g1::TRINITY_DN14219_c0_g1_i4::g.22597::m.22597
MIVFVRCRDQTVPCEVGHDDTVADLLKQAEGAFGGGGFLSFQNEALNVVTPLADSGLSAQVTVEYTNALQWFFDQPPDPLTMELEDFGTANMRVMELRDEGRIAVCNDSDGDYGTVFVLRRDGPGFEPADQVCRFRLLGNPEGFSHFLWACEEDEYGTTDKTIHGVKILLPDTDVSERVFTIRFGVCSMHLSRDDEDAGDDTPPLASGDGDPLALPTSKDTKHVVPYTWAQGKRMVAGIYMYKTHCSVEIVRGSC